MPGENTRKSNALPVKSEQSQGEVEPLVRAAKIYLYAKFTVLSIASIVSDPAAAKHQMEAIHKGAQSQVFM